MEADTTTTMQETVYGTGVEDSHVMSEKVQSLASSIYQELERMIERYDEDVVKELMPLVVSVLESLDSAVMDNQEHEVELELLREDNEQLMTQYEREKQLRRTSEQRLMEIEYSTEDDQREYVSKVESLESIVRMLELKTKNSTDHASRLEEKEMEMRKEYSKLHERYTELFKTHMDYMERTKILFGSDRIDSVNHRPRNLHFSHGKSGAILTNMTQENSNKNLVSPAELPSLISLNPSSDSNTSLKSELQDMHVSSVLSPMSPLFDDKSLTEQNDKSTMEKSQITDQIMHSDRATGTKSCWMEDDFESNVNDVVVTSPEMDEVEELNSFSFDIGPKSEKKRPNTLYQELSFQDSDALGEVDECADVTGEYTNPGDYASSDSESELDHENKVADNFYGMGKEVENLISENNELLATKNALNIVKDDLIAKVDELTSEQEILREDLKSYMAVKEKLTRKVSELEEELKKMKSEMDKNKSSKSDDEEDVPMAQRKRFTRVEMARVLMERNQYKERLMELQEAVRWTEMIRASRSDSSLDTKRTKSSIWKFFSNLFNANEKPQRKTLPYVNVHYNAPTSNASPALETMRRKRLGDRHRSFDHHDTDLASEKLQQQRATERREQYKQVRAHVCKDNGRLQAYGWSLPTKNATATGKTTTDSVVPSKSASLAPVPVPVFCRPLSSQEPGMKVWCAAGVDLSGGKPEDLHRNVSVVGSSMFYVDTDDAAGNSESAKQQIEDVKSSADRNESSSSIVWFCTSSHTGSTVAIVDANNPDKILDTFRTSNSDLLCITSVPGVKMSDYVVEESFMKLGTTKRKDEDDSASKQETGGSATQIGKISFVTGKRDSRFSSRSSISEDRTISPPMSPSIELAQIPEDFQSSHVIDESMDKMPSVLPTMWLGSQSGEIHIHSSVAQVWRPIHSAKLQDSVLSIVHIKGRVFCALADGSVAVFHRSDSGEWDLSNYHVIDLGFPHHSIRCMTIVNDNVWCGYRNCIRVLSAQTLSVVDSFDAHPRKESQVRQMSWAGDGVWITIRLDSTLRLYHASTHQHLQDVDIEPYVSKMLGTGKLGFSFVRITAMLVSCKRLWMGTGNGVIISVPLTDTTKQSASENVAKAPGGMVRVYNKSVSTTGYIPYCTMAQAQLSFHGHRDAVKFFVSVPGSNSTAPEASSESGSKSESEGTKSSTEDENTNVMNIISGGEGYIDFRVGDGDDDDMLTAIACEEKKAPLITDPKNDKSHLIVWQVAIPEE